MPATVLGLSPSRDKPRNLTITRLDAAWVSLTFEYGATPVQVECHVELRELVDALQEAGVLAPYTPPQGLMVQAPIP